MEQKKYNRKLRTKTSEKQRLQQKLFMLKGWIGSEATKVKHIRRELKELPELAAPYDLHVQLAAIDSQLTYLCVQFNEYSELIRHLYHQELDFKKATPK